MQPSTSGGIVPGSSRASQARTVDEPVARPQTLLRSRPRAGSTGKGYLVNRFLRAALGAVIALTFLAGAGTVRAQDMEEKADQAKRLLEEGIQQLTAKNFDTAI